VVADGARMAGGECPVCGWLAPGTGLPCPECGSEMRPVPDLLHRAMDRAVEQGGKVEVVHGDSAGRLLDAGSGLAALLRYL
jgi:peptide subunit release factor 1 (eRF1)